MEWEKQKLLVELEIEKIKIEMESLSKWVWFLQACFLLTVSATVSEAYRSGTTVWSISGTFLTVLTLLDLLINFRKLAKLKDRIELFKQALERSL